MKHARTGFGVLLAAVAVGCASGNVEPSAQEPAAVNDTSDEPVVIQLVTVAPSGDDYRCRKEVVTGSHRRVEVCRTRAQREYERQQARDWLRSGGFDGGLTNVSTPRARRPSGRSAD